MEVHFLFKTSFILTAFKSITCKGYKRICASFTLSMDDHLSLGQLSSSNSVRFLRY